MARAKKVTGGVNEDGLIGGQPVTFEQIIAANKARESRNKKGASNAKPETMPSEPVSVESVESTAEQEETE